MDIAREVDDEFESIILIEETDNYVYTVLRTKEKSKKIEKIFQEVKDRLPGEWSIDDLIDELEKRNIDFTVNNNWSTIYF